MTRDDLRDFYHGYIACLNRRDWPRLGAFVGDDVHYNGRLIGLSGYRAMLERDVVAIPDLRFVVALLVSEPPTLAARLDFTCSPKEMFLGLPVEGRTVSFAENVFYTVAGGRFAQVWSVIDKSAIEAQL